MPLYFAYGANLDRVGMAQRCPGATVLGRAHLAGWRFAVMVDGYATVLPAERSVVHGLLWRVTAADWPALDDYEDVDRGLYRRAVLTILQEDRPREAAVYLASSTTIGKPQPGYMEAVAAAATACGLPSAYLDELRSWCEAG